MVNKKLLQRELCSLWMPLEFSQYTDPDGGGRVPASTRSSSADDGVSGSSGSSSSSSSNSSSNSTGRGSLDRLSGSEPSLAASDVDVASEGDDGDSSSSLRTRNRGLGLLASSDALRFPTPLAPLDFTVAPQFARAGDGVRAPLELQRALLDGVGDPPAVSLLQSAGRAWRGQQGDEVQELDARVSREHGLRCCRAGKITAERRRC